MHVLWGSLFLTTGPLELALVHRVPWDDVAMAHEVVALEKCGQLLGLGILTYGDVWRCEGCMGLWASGQIGEHFV